MSSNKYLVLSFLIMIFFTGCHKKAGEEEPVNAKPFFSYETLVNKVKVLCNTEAALVLLGNFKGDTTQQAAAIIEVNKKDEKIGFALIGIKDTILEMKDETPPVRGALKGCNVDKINLPGFSNDLVYYNSQIYFMGSNSGEVFAYIIDFKIHKTYYAHFLAEPGKAGSLYISEKDNKEIEKYFIDTFRKDYSAFKQIAKDHVLN